MAERTLTAGVARANITPPVGIHLVGYILRVEPAVGVDQDLYATVLVLADGRAKVAIVDCDLAVFTVDRADAVRERIAAAIGTPRSHVLLACSHTHNGPPTGIWDFGPTTGPVEQAYVAALDHYLVGAAVTADHSRRPARVGAGLGHCDIAINRIEELPDGTMVLGQNPDGPTDHGVGVVRIDGLDRRPIAAIVNYQAHPVVLGPEPLLISPDYPGVVRRVVEQATGATCLYLMGAAGDQMPRTAGTEDQAAVRRVGGILGHEAAKVFLGIETRPLETRKRRVRSLAEVLVYEEHEVPGQGGTLLGAAERRVALPLVPAPNLGEAQRVLEETTAEVERARQADSSARTLHLGSLELNWARRLVALAESGPTDRTVEASIQALRLGDIAIVTAPGEAFVRMGLDAKARSPLPHTLYAAYANGVVSYIPTADQYPKPGQRRLTPDGINFKGTLLTPLAPECAELVVNTGVGLLRGLIEEQDQSPGVREEGARS